MPRFHVHIRNRNTYIKDLEGVDLPASIDVLEYAAEKATRLVTDRQHVCDWLACNLEIEDEHGEITMILSLPSVLDPECRRRWSLAKAA